VGFKVRWNDRAPSSMGENNLEGGRAPSGPACDAKKKKELLKIIQTRDPRNTPSPQVGGQKGKTCKGQKDPWENWGAWGEPGKKM